MIRALDRSELENALSLVWKVFSENEADGYSEAGKQAFWNVIHSVDYLDTLTAYGAFDDDKIIGIIAVRNYGSHIALFFVDGAYQQRGIGKQLWSTMLNENTSDIITVHSSLYAKAIYEKLGFILKDTVQDDGGIRYIPMEYLHFMDMLLDRDDKKAFAKTKEIAAASEACDQYYGYLDDFAKLLNNKKSYIRIRALTLCCSQARWDEACVLANYLPQMLQLLHDEKPTVVRQSLNALKEIVVFRPEVCEAIAGELGKIDLSMYKDSMSGLIRKDINELVELISERNS